MKLILAENTFFCFLFVLAPSFIPVMEIERISTVFCLHTLDRDVLLLSELKNLVITIRNNKKECITNYINTKPKRVPNRQLYNVSTNEGKERIGQVKYKQFHSAFNKNKVFQTLLGQTVTGKKTDKCDEEKMKCERVYQ